MEHRALFSSVSLLGQPHESMLGDRKCFFSAVIVLPEAALCKQI